MWYPWQPVRYASRMKEAVLLQQMRLIAHITHDGDLFGSSAYRAEQQVNDNLFHRSVYPREDEIMQYNWAYTVSLRQSHSRVHAGLLVKR